MTQPDLELEGPHWDFALRLYGRDGVAPACLVLQDEAGVDVIVLMMALFAASRGAAAGTVADVAALDAQVRGWRDDVVRPLRAVRRRMKEMRPGGPHIEALRNRIKADELQAEKIELAMLARVVNGDFEHGERGRLGAWGPVRRCPTQ